MGGLGWGWLSSSWPSPNFLFLRAKCALPLIQVILVEQKMYTSGAALRLHLHCAFLLSSAEPWVNVKLLWFSQLKHVQWQQRDLCFTLLHGILSVLCKTILRRPGFCKFLKQLERVFSTSLLMIDHIFSWFCFFPRLWYLIWLFKYLLFKVFIYLFVYF